MFIARLNSFSCPRAWPDYEILEAAVVDERPVSVWLPSSASFLRRMGHNSDWLDNNCAFCIVPSVRGEKFPPFDDVVAEVERFPADG